jgi:hypothetical protein
MFRDEKAVADILKAVSEEHRKRNGDSCTLRNLQSRLYEHPELFNPNTAPKDKKTVTEVLGLPVTIPYVEAAIRQTVYRIVKKYKIWLSRSSQNA